MMQHTSVLGIDVGTSGVRAALFDEEGNQIDGAQATTRRAPGNFTELDPDLLVEEVRRTINELPARPVAADPEIEAVAISVFWHGLMGVDANGAPTTPLLTWADTRAVQEAEELRAEFDEREVHARTGCRFHPSYWPAKLRWLKRERREQFDTTRLWLGFGEYLCLKLFGDVAPSVSLASATGLFNQRTCDWDFDFAEALGVSKDHLPQIENENPLRSKKIFIVGDGAANNIGGGCSAKDKVALMIGTSGAMRVVFAGEPPADLSPALWSYRVDRERVVIGGALSDGGGLLQWLVQALHVDDRDESLQQQLAALEPDAHGLTILPFWSGERSTSWRAKARGGIFGLRHDTTTVEIIRASLEAIAYRFALIANALDEIARGAAIVATGNALRSSPVWLQIIADVLGRPVLFGGAAEASIRGAALLALEGVGKIANIEAVPVLVDEVFEPDMQRHARYREGLGRQQELYELLFEERETRINTD
ncbi:MAG TPA: gluconokinase [Pyrinomonadaceae bacterium]|nr:gluconokinase [Pyrinomonadaceae bacterium]